MSSDTSRSEQVVESYKQHKLALSALHRIHELILGFESARVADLRLARIGLVLLLAFVAMLAYFFVGSGQVTVA
jgi:uncharacterized membrane protein YebE (DUF533 family)